MRPTPRSVGFLCALGLVLALNGAHALSELVGGLVGDLGVSPTQAAGGAGAIFGYAKDNLSADDFATVAKGVPDMDGLLAAAPEPSSSGGALSALGGLLGGKSGGVAQLAGSFETLGLDAGMVQKFLPIVLDYVGSASGPQALSLLQGLF